MTTLLIIAVGSAIGGLLLAVVLRALQLAADIEDVAHEVQR